MVQYSFIIPVYNCVDCLRNCVQSILATQLTDIEILMVDDGSTDGSSELCDKLAIENHTIHVFHQKNSGVSAARNVGLSKAQGEWILFADSDDTFESEGLRNLLQRLTAYSDIDLAVFGLSFDYYYHSKCYRRERKGYSNEGCFNQAEWHKAWGGMDDSNYWVPVWNKVYRARVIRENGIRFPEDMFIYEDYVFSLRYLSYCKDIFVTGDVIYRYRQSEDEKNAARRLLRIPHLNSFIDQLNNELGHMAARQSMELSIDSYLLKQYQMLAGIKIRSCSVSQIRIVCNDFSDWIERNALKHLVASGSYADDLLNKRILRIVYKRTKTSVRHWIAVRLKAFGIYPSE